MTKPGTSVEPEGAGKGDTPGPASIRKTLKKSERLKKQAGFDFLFSKGRSWRKDWLSARYSFDFAPEHCSSALMAAFAVPSKKFRKAVIRNRIRRRMREIWRIHNPVLKEKLMAKSRRLVVWMKFNHDQELSYQDMESAVKELIHYLSSLS